MRINEFKQLIRKMVKEEISTYIRKEEKEEKPGETESKKASEQVKAFLNSLEKSSLAKKLKNIDTDKEKVEILSKFADMIDFPKNKINRLSSELKS